MLRFRDVTDQPGMVARAPLPELAPRFEAIGFVRVGLVKSEAPEITHIAELYEEPDRSWFIRNSKLPSTVMHSPTQDTFLDYSPWYGGEPSMRLRSFLADGSLCETVRAIERIPIHVQQAWFGETGLRRQMRGHVPSGGRSKRRVHTMEPSELWDAHQRHLADFSAFRDAAPAVHHSIEDYIALAGQSIDHNGESLKAAGELSLQLMLYYGAVVTLVAIPVFLLRGSLGATLWLLGNVALFATSGPRLAHQLGRWFEPGNTPEFLTPSVTRARSLKLLNGMVRAMIFVVTFAALTPPTATALLLNMDGPRRFTPTAANEDERLLGQQMLARVPELSSDGGLARIWTEQGRIVVSDPAHVAVRSVKEDGPTLVISARHGDAGDLPTLALLAELPALLDVADVPFSWVVEARIAEAPLERGDAQLWIDDVAMTVSNGGFWPVDVLFAAPGTQLLVHGAWRDDDVIRALVTGLQGGRLHVRGALRPAMTSESAVPTAHLRTGGVWNRGSVAEVDAAALGRTAQAVTSSIQRFPLAQVITPASPSLWIYAFIAVVLAVTGRMFWRLFRGPEKTEAELDEAWNRGHGSAVLGDAAAKGQDWVDQGDADGFADFVGGLPAEDRAVWIMIFAHQFTPETLDLRCEEAPDDAVAFHLRGHARLRWAWKARTHAWADEVSRKQLEAFEAQLPLALDDLNTAARLDVTDATILADTLLALKGQDAPIRQLQACFDEGLSRDSTSFALYNSMMVAVSAKWTGSNSQMYALARRATKNGPAGSPLHALIVLAHVERWVALCYEDVEDADDYPSSPFVVNEITTAYNAFSDHAGTQPSDLLAWNAFAMMFDQAGKSAEAQRCFKAIDGRYTEVPWCDLGDPGECFRDAQKRAEQDT
ncbi:MAG: hypothetical protein GWP91_16130 [Rhodobacterales bacterium]|nr:hypothetical protein [Rhodobacterales bacterium]